jgi:hypothetical protein
MTTSITVKLDFRSVFANYLVKIMILPLHLQIKHSTIQKTKQKTPNKKTHNTKQ